MYRAIEQYGCSKNSHTDTSINFDKAEKVISQRKFYFQHMVSNGWISISKKQKKNKPCNPYLITGIKINYKGIIKLNIKPKIIKLVEENRRKS